MRRLLLIAALVFSACGEDREIPPAQQGVDASVLDAGGTMDAGPWKACVRTCFDTGQAVSCTYAMGQCETEGLGPGGCTYATGRFDGSGAGESPPCQ